MAQYRATLAYDGAAYQGFQRQRDGISTVQAMVEQAIAAVTGQAATLTAAGRTDTGVHASGQVIAFVVDWSRSANALLRAINAHLPSDIVLQTLSQCAGFHPRFDAQARCYRYMVIQSSQRQPLLRHRAWWVNRLLDFEAIQAASKMLIGEHDFAAFGKPPQGDNTVRRIFVSEWIQRETASGIVLEYSVEATAFLHHMVRRIVGTQVDVGIGRIDLTEFKRIFESADLSLAKRLAPPQGLILEKVRYPDDD